MEQVAGRASLVSRQLGPALEHTAKVVELMGELKLTVQALDCVRAPRAGLGHSTAGSAAGSVFEQATEHLRGRANGRIWRS